MARAKEEPIRDLEAGELAFYSHRGHLLMCPGARVILVGRKRITDRFWALVIASRPHDAEEIGAGEYRIYEHDGHAHLTYRLDHHVDEIARREVGLARSGGFIVTVMNPDPTVWGGETSVQEELFPGHLVIRTPFPPALQERFGERKYAKLDTTEFLDHPGAELVLIVE